MKYKSCTKPCNDCPYRVGVLPYQLSDQAEQNVEGIQDPRLVEICHHTYYENYRFNTGMQRPPEKQKMCAGAILFARNLRTEKDHDPGDSVLPYALQSLVYASVLQFLEGVVAENNQQAQANWFMIQPGSLRDRIREFHRLRRLSMSLE